MGTPQRGFLVGPLAVAFTAKLSTVVTPKEHKAHTAAFAALRSKAGAPQPSTIIPMPRIVALPKSVSALCVVIQARERDAPKKEGRFQTFDAGAASRQRPLLSRDHSSVNASQLPFPCFKGRSASKRSGFSSPSTTTQTLLVAVECSAKPKVDAAPLRFCGGGIDG